MAGIFIVKNNLVKKTWVHSPQNLPTTIARKRSISFQQLRNLQKKPKFDPVFKMDVVYFEGEPLFVQPIEVINPEGLRIRVEILYSVCDDKQCLAPETKTFEVDLESGKSATVNAEITEEDIAKTNALSINLKGADKYSALKEDEKGLLTLFLLGFFRRTYCFVNTLRISYDPVDRQLFLLKVLRIKRKDYEMRFYMASLYF